MSSPTLVVSGVTLTVNDQGVYLAKGWLGEQISTADIGTVRDWLNANFPASPITSAIAAAGFVSRGIPHWPPLPPPRPSHASKRELLLQILSNQEKTMSALSDGIAVLVADDQSLKNGLAKLAADDAKALLDLQNALAALNATSPDVQAAVAALQTVHADIQGMDTSIASQDAADVAADPANATPPAPPVTPPAS